VSGYSFTSSFAVASKSHRAAIRPPPEFAVAPPQSARAPLPYRRCNDEYGGIEYGGLPVKYSAFVIRLYSLSGCTATYFGMHYRADNLAFDAVRAGPAVFRSPLEMQICRR
jgi:hypothetical protein